mgnify:CR=1 FL=1
MSSMSESSPTAGRGKRRHISTVAFLSKALLSAKALGCGGRGYIRRHVVKARPRRAGSGGFSLWANGMMERGPMPEMTQ